MKLVLSPGDGRFIELDEGETVESVSQHDIAHNVDVTSAQKVSDVDCE